MSILDYGPDSSPKLDQVIKEPAASEVQERCAESEEPAVHMDTWVDTTAQTSPPQPFSAPVSLHLSLSSVGNYGLSWGITF